MRKGTDFTEQGSAHQVTAIRVSHRIGQQLIEDHPEIADMYRNGALQEELARRFIPDEVERGMSVARTAVGVALHHLIPEIEMAGLLKGRKVTTGSSSGKKTIERKRGLFGLDEKRLAEIKRLGGQATRDRKVGIHGYTEEEKSEAVKKGLLTKGLVPFSHEELARLLELANDPQYIRPTRKSRDGEAPNYVAISEILHREFGTTRTRESLGAKVNSIKRAKREEEKNALEQEAGELEKRLAEVRARLGKFNQ